MSIAYDIKHKAQDKLLTVALDLLADIINYHMRHDEDDSEVITGIINDEGCEEDIYEIGIHSRFFVDVDVQDTYSLDCYTEKRRVESFVEYMDEDALYVNIEGEEDPIALRALPFDSIVVLVDELESMRAELIKE